MNEAQHSEVFRQWASQYSGLMARVARAYTANPEDCQDLLQEILLQVWTSIPRFQRKASESTWIYRVALNTALAWQRKKRRQPSLGPLIGTGHMPEEPSRSAEDRERIEALYSAIRSLPKTESALVLLYMDGLSYREIADVMGISESNVGVKLTRARKALAELMKEVVYE